MAAEGDEGGVGGEKRAAWGDKRGFWVEKRGFSANKVGFFGDEMESGGDKTAASAGKAGEEMAGMASGEGSSCGGASGGPSPPPSASSSGSPRLGGSLVLLGELGMLGEGLPTGSSSSPAPGEGSLVAILVLRSSSGTTPGGRSRATKPCCSSSRARGRSCGSFRRQRETKSRNCSDQLWGCLRPGGSLWAMWYRALIAFSWNRGGLRSASSMQVMPSDHTSARPS